jgi:hypothetical protein
MLMSIAQRQLNICVRAPPTSGPTANAIAPIDPHSASARFRLRLSRKTSVMMASVGGVSSAAPQPWSARATMSIGRPAANAAASEAPVKRTAPATKIRRRPMVSASRPPVSSSAAKDSR